jgi:hypothetical protein
MTTVHDLQDTLASFKKSTLASGNGNGTPDAWQRLIVEKLALWARHPEEFADDGLKAPTTEVLADARDFAVFCRTRGVQAPLRVAPDGSGGVSFEWRFGALYQTVEFRAGGEAELLFYENGKLLRRQPIG